MTGRGENILKGAAIGGATGALGGIVANNFGLVGVYAMMAAGAGVAYSQGGLDGLAYYGAGVLGAYAGAFAGQQVVKAMTGVVQSGQNGATQDSVPTPAADDKASADLEVSSYETPGDYYDRMEPATKPEEYWRFDPKGHGGPHFQTPDDLRYDAKTLEPREHLGKKPPDLSKSAVKNLMRSKAWQQASKWFLRGAKVGGIAVGIILELATPSEAF